MYIYGNVVPKPEYTPKRQVQEPSKPQKKVSHQVRTNRRRALRMSPAYVLVIAVATMMALLICVNYVKLQSRMTSYSKNITALQKEFADLKEENNTRYNAVMDSVNLEEVRERAQEKLGMVYADADQIVEYQSPSTDYVRQYESIPKDGILARSDIQ